MSPLIILAILMTIGFIAMIIISYSIYKYREKNCPDKSFWCANRGNYEICKTYNDNDTTTYKKDCCVGGNDNWVQMMGTEDKNPNTNGYNKNCVDNNGN